MRFIVPLTLSELRQARGMGARAHLGKIQEIFQGQLHQMVEYMQPVLCQCKPKGDDIDIDILRNNLSDILMEEIKVQRSGSIK